jgi:predicted ATPase
MIKSISLTNYKAFSNKTNIELAPLTILSGINSSGKSTILQSLLLLKQSFKESPTKEALTLDGDYLHYTQFNEVVFGLPKNPDAIIEYQFSLTDNKNKPLGKFLIEFGIDVIYRTRKKGVVVKKFLWESDDKHDKIILLYDKGKYKYPKNKIDLLPKLPEGFEIIQIEVDFRAFIPTMVLIKAKNKTKTVKFGFPLGYIDILEKPLQTLISDLRNIIYIGPSRAKPQRAYIQENVSLKLTEDGSNAAQIFWIRKDEYIKWANSKMKVIEAVVYCFKTLGVLQKVEPKVSNKIIYQILFNLISYPEKKVTIADVGFGFSQLLPIILFGILSNENSLILFEQPEIHLHPSCQANLADLFIQMIESNRRLLIETHSDHLVNRLRLRVIEKRELADKVKVLFVTQPKKGSWKGAIIKTLNLSEDGAFDFWPEGFCDESQKTAQAIISARFSLINTKNK